MAARNVSILQAVADSKRLIVASQSIPGTLNVNDLANTFEVAQATIKVCTDLTSTYSECTDNTNDLPSTASSFFWRRRYRSPTPYLHQRVEFESRVSVSLLTQVASHHGATFT